MRPSLMASLAAGLVTSALALPAARAQPSEEGFDKAPEDTLEGKAQTDQEKKQGDRMPGEKDKTKPADKPDPELDPYEDPHKAYRFIGMRFRNVVLPKFMLNIFADGGATVNAFTFGPEFTTRKNHIELNVALSYADYS